MEIFHHHRLRSFVRCLLGAVEKCCSRILGYSFFSRFWLEIGFYPWSIVVPVVSLMNHESRINNYVLSVKVKTTEFTSASTLFISFFIRRQYSLAPHSPPAEDFEAFQNILKIALLLLMKCSAMLLPECCCSSGTCKRQIGELKKKKNSIFAKFKILPPPSLHVVGRRAEQHSPPSFLLLLLL